MRLLTITTLLLTALFTVNNYQQCPAPPAVDWADLTYNHPDQIATRTGTLTAINQCTATVKFPEGDSIQTPVTSLLLGQVGGLVGMTVTVRYLKANSALGYIIGPFKAASPLPTPSPVPTPSPTPTPTVTPTPTPVPSPSPSPTSTPTPTPPPTSGTIHVATNTDGIGALIQAVGPQVTSCTVGPNADCAMIVLQGVYSMIANKADYVFTNQGQSATVPAGGTVEVSFTATPLSSPSPSPTPSPTPTPVPSPSPSPSPSPTPTPTPTPIPTPMPCTMTVPDLTMNQWSTTTLTVTLSGTSGVFSVTAIPSTGQLTVSPQSQTVNGTSAVAAFRVSSKKKSASIAVTSPCGSKTANVTVH